ncbi:MAG: DUF1127 domain-containing protein [Pseudomonadota bacterium]
MLDTLYCILSRDRARAKAEMDLKGLSDRQLSDMGLHRSQIEAFLGKGQSCG